MHYKLETKTDGRIIHQKIDSAFKIYKKHSALKLKKVEPNEPCDIKFVFVNKIIEMDFLSMEHIFQNSKGRETALQQFYLQSLLYITNISL